jgi:hypothetical protein
MLLSSRTTTTDCHESLRSLERKLPPLRASLGLCWALAAHAVEYYYGQYDRHEYRSANLLPEIRFSGSKLSTIYSFEPNLVSVTVSNQNRRNP